MATNLQVKLGDPVQDSISGFTGIATGRAVYLHGCVRVQVTPKALDKDGKLQEPVWFDEGQLVGVTVDKTDRLGGPMPDPARAPDAW